MTCNLANTIIHFHKSGIKVRPLSLDIRNDRRETDQFDSVQATLTSEAGEYIIDHNVHKEPVTIEMGDHGYILYRGYYANDGVQLGSGESILKIQDPRRILRDGYINKEWGRASLETVATYVFNHRADPHGVLTGLEFNTPDADELALQFEQMNDRKHWEPSWSDPLNAETEEDGLRDDSEVRDWKLGAENWLRETLPLVDGDGNFDFRDDSPYDCLREVANIWETDWYVKRDGTLIVGNSDLNADVFPASRYRGDMWVEEYNLPQDPTPIKGVYVKGKKDYKGGHDDGTMEDIWNFVTDKEKFETRAYAGFTDPDLTETVVLDEKKNTADPETLKQIALRGLLKRYMQSNKGNLILDALTSEEVDTEDFCDLGIGDRLVIPPGWGCGKPDPGVYEVHSVHHKISGSDGWTITVKVTQEVTKDLEEKFWYFDPTDPEQTQDDVEMPDMTHMP